MPGAENSVDLLNFVHVRNGTFQVEEQVVFNAIFSGEAGIDIGGGPFACAFGVQHSGNYWSTRPINAESDLNLNPCFIEGHDPVLECLSNAWGRSFFWEHPR